MQQTVVELLMPNEQPNFTFQLELANCLVTRAYAMPAAEQLAACLTLLGEYKPQIPLTDHVFSHLFALIVHCDTRPSGVDSVVATMLSQIFENSSSVLLQVLLSMISRLKSTVYGVDV